MPRRRPGQAYGTIPDRRTEELNPVSASVPVMGIRLTEFEVARDLPLLRAWLRLPHVAPWWGDAEAALAHAATQPPERHRIVTVEGHACGYVCWQPLSPTEVTMAGLDSLPDRHMDVDILIGEEAFLGRGIGPVALQLLAEILSSQGVSSMGLGTHADNARACRAFRKAGFQQRADFQEARRRVLYFTRDLGVPV